MPSLQYQRGQRAGLLGSAFERVPHEIVARIAYLASQSLRDVWSLYALCLLFRGSIMPGVLWEIIRGILMSFGIVNPRSFLAELRCVGGLVAGPALLSAFSPDESDALERCGLTSRLEIHVPSTVQALRVVKKHLTSGGYSLQHELDHEDAVDFAGNVLGYQDFGRTVPKILDYDRRPSVTTSQACTILVNASPHSALTGVLELPTTLFMLYIEDDAVNVLYPQLTLHGRGLINTVEGPMETRWAYLHRNADNWNTDDHKTPMDWFVGNMQSTGFRLERSLNAFPSLSNHQCRIHGSCPATERRRNDGQELRLPYAGGKPGPSSSVTWTLKSSWTCTPETSNPTAFGEKVSPGGRYVVGSQTYRDTEIYWETGDEYGVGWYLKARHRREDLQLEDCETAEGLLGDLNSLEDTSPMDESTEHRIPRLRLLAFPDQRCAISDYFDVDECAQRGIVRLLNVVGHLQQVLPILVKLASLISNEITSYVTEYTPAAALEIHSNMVGCFIWLKACDFDNGGGDAIGPYAVAFYVICGESFRAICLAKMLIEFIATITEEPRKFDVVSVAYRFASSGVVGIIFFDNDLRDTFDKVDEESKTDIDTMDRYEGRPVTFWPVNRVVTLSEGAYAFVLRQVSATRALSWPLVVAGGAH
ncbi:hypothetical protein FA13DRAFT_1786259 [Coprinellus micaceus]|uniref:Uncharacterized protein n=1 Tax=Coprinellus micaceus TaxID=71717 RepID=A0A4Y7TWX6_COPMI|nr:hypothetical protein FA13DRAFT_1786259 [Coprinellus micaceus]